jgi:hypothetical protein
MVTREEKIRNAIVFFALEHERLARKPLGVNFLHKYLAFLDFSSIAKIGRPAIGVLYRTMRRGSLPTDSWERADIPKDDRFVIVSEKGGGHAVKTVAKPDLKCFSSFELEEMKRIVKINADRVVKAFDLRDDTREKTWELIENAATQLSDVGSPEKAKEVYAMSGLTVLIQRYVKQLEELETSMKEVKHKLETVMEASRLLEEEGLSEDNPSEGFKENRTFLENR